MEYVAKTKELTKCYRGFCALNKVNISLRRGEIYGLVGDNGAGKSTFLKLLAGQIFPTEGSLSLFGEHEAPRLAGMRRRMGVLIEQAGFYPQLSVESNLEYFRIQKGVPGKNAVASVLEMTGLTAVKDKKGRELSVGMKQRLGLAAALMGVPELLILDEPINGLDPSGIIEMRALLLRLNREKNITILLSSHILSELEQIATVYGFLQNGVLLEQISADALMKKCADYVEIRVSDTEQYIVLLEQLAGHQDYQVLPAEEYSRLASDAGLYVSELTRCRQSLEEYYMNLKRGGAASC